MSEINTQQMKLKNKKKDSKLNKTIKEITKAHLKIIYSIDDILFHDFLMTFNPEIHKIIPFPYLESDFKIEESIFKNNSIEMIESEKENYLNETCIPNNLLFEEEEENTFQLNNNRISTNNSEKNEFLIKSKINNNLLKSKSIILKEKEIFDEPKYAEMSILISLGDRNIAIENGKISNCYLTSLEKEYVLKIYKIYREYETSQNI